MSEVILLQSFLTDLKK